MKNFISEATQAVNNYSIPEPSQRRLKREKNDSYINSSYCQSKAEIQADFYHSEPFKEVSGDNDDPPEDDEHERDLARKSHTI